GGPPGGRPPRRGRARAGRRALLARRGRQRDGRARRGAPRRRPRARPRPMTVPPRTGVLWRGPLTDPSGYAAGGRAFVRGLAELGAAVRAEPQAWNPRAALSRE